MCELAAVAAAAAMKVRRLNFAKLLVHTCSHLVQTPLEA